MSEENFYRGWVKRTFNFLRSIEHQYWIAWSLLAVSLVGCFIAYARINKSLDRNSLFPPDNERYEIKEMRVAIASKVCPEIEQMGAVASVFEACMHRYHDGRLSPLSSHTIQVPSVEQILNSRPPRFLDLIAPQGASDIAEAIRRKETYLLLFEVPRRYFTPWDLRDKRAVLTFSMMVSGLACIEGRCFQPISQYASQPNGIPLITHSDNDNGPVSIWVFGKDDSFSLGVSLSHGLFVSSNEKLLPLYYNGLIGVLSKPLIFSVIFSAILLGVLVYCLALGYLDYAALAYFAFSVTAFIVCEQRALFPSFSDLEWHRHRLLAGGNVGVASIAFALATARIHGHKVLAWIILADLILAATIFWVLSDDVRILVARTPSYTTNVAIVLISIPSAISFIGALHCSYLAILARKKGGKNSQRIRLWRRVFIEQLPYTIILFLFGLEAVRLGKARSAGIDSEMFLPISSSLFFAIFGVMIFNTILQQLFDKKNTPLISEADSNRQAMSPKSFQVWASRPREGIITNIDVGGMTAAAKKLGPASHSLMADLGEALYRISVGHGYHWLIDSTKGDEWLLPLSRKGGQNIADDLEEVAFALAAYAPHIENLVELYARYYGVELSLHTNIIAVREYSLGAETDEKSEKLNFEVKALMNDLFPAVSVIPNFRRKLDFRGDEVNYCLKYQEKAPDGEIWIVASHDMFSERLIASTLMFCPLEECDFLQGINDDVRERIKRLRLMHARLPWAKNSAQQQAG